MTTPDDFLRSIPAGSPSLSTEAQGTSPEDFLRKLAPATPEELKHAASTAIQAPGEAETAWLNFSSKAPILPYLRNAAAYQLQNPPDDQGHTLSYDEMSQRIEQERQAGNKAHPGIVETPRGSAESITAGKQQDYSDFPGQITPDQAATGLGAAARELPGLAGEGLGLLPWGRVAKEAGTSYDLIRASRNPELETGLRELAGKVGWDKAKKSVATAGGVGFVEGASANADKPLGKEQLVPAVIGGVGGAGATAAGPLIAQGAKEAVNWVSKTLKMTDASRKAAAQEALPKFGITEDIPEKPPGGVEGVQPSTAQLTGSSDALHAIDTLRPDPDIRKSLQAQEAANQTAMQKAATEAGLVPAPGAEEKLHAKFQEAINPDAIPRNTIQDVADRLGVKPNHGLVYDEGLEAERTALGDRNYARAYNQPINLEEDPGLKRILNTPDMRKSQQAAYRLMQNDTSIPQADLDRVTKALNARVQTMPDGSVEFYVDTPSYQFLHYVRQSMDGMIQAERGTALSGGNRTVYRSLCQQRAALDRFLKTSNSEFAAADAAHADLSSQMSASGAGADLFKEAKKAQNGDFFELLQKEVNNFTPKQLEAFRTRGVNAYQEVLSHLTPLDSGEAQLKGLTAVQKFLSNPSYRQAMQVLLGDQYEPWLKSLQKSVNVDPKLAASLATNHENELWGKGAQTFVDKMLAPGDVATYSEGMKFLNRSDTAMNHLRGTIGNKFVSEVMSAPLTEGSATVRTSLMDYDKLTKFLTDYKHILGDARVFSPEQRELFTSLAQDAELLGRQPTEKTIGSAAAKEIKDTYLSRLVLSDTGAATAGYKGRIFGNVVSDIANLISRGGVDTYRKLLGDAMVNPAVAKAILSKPSPAQDARIRAILAPYMKTNAPGVP